MGGYGRAMGGSGGGGEYPWISQGEAKDKTRISPLAYEAAQLVLFWSWHLFVVPGVDSKA